jgi:hypothetical protein
MGGLRRRGAVVDLLGGTAGIPALTAQLANGKAEEAPNVSIFCKHLHGMSRLFAELRRMVA